VLMVCSWMSLEDCRMRYYGVVSMLLRLMEVRGLVSIQEGLSFFFLRSRRQR
jgi:hypothetical protein